MTRLSGHQNSLSGNKQGVNDVTSHTHAFFPQNLLAYHVSDPSFGHWGHSSDKTHTVLVKSAFGNTLPEALNED